MSEPRLSVIADSRVAVLGAASHGSQTDGSASGRGPPALFLPSPPRRWACGQSPERGGKPLEQDAAAERQQTDGQRSERTADYADATRAMKSTIERKLRMGSATRSGELKQDLDFRTKH